MRPEVRYDVVVVGAGPAGSVAALILARAGARVALVDRAAFPRDKACGDLVGPRAVRLLAELGAARPPGAPVDEMVVVGPTGRRVRLPAPPGRGYADHGLVCPRREFDAFLRERALAAGADAVRGRVVGLSGLERIIAVELAGGHGPLAADAVVAADGATSALARGAGLVDDATALWGFAVRGYLPGELALPVICLRDDTPRRALPGYGWAFPGIDGMVNVGFGLGFGTRRERSRLAAAGVAAFVRDLARFGVLPAPISPPRLTGGWLRMGGAGTRPGRGRLLLAGDAAGLVNPLQGEGIGPAMESGRLAATALLTAPGRPAPGYRDALAARFGRYLSAAGPLHRSALAHPVAFAATTRLVTAPALSRALATAWALFWNDLAADAETTPGALVARVVLAAGARLGRPAFG